MSIANPTNITEQAAAAGQQKRRTGRKKGALGLSVKRLDAWPEWFRGIVRYCIVAGETFVETKRRCQQFAGTMRLTAPTMSAGDWAWFGETDPAVLATLEECERDQDDRGHHPLSSKAARVEFLIGRFEQLEYWKAGITSLTSNEWLTISKAQFEVLQRISFLVDGPLCGPTDTWEKQSWVSRMAKRSDWIPGDETAYVEDRDRLELSPTLLNQAAGRDELATVKVCAFLPISHLRILHDMERCLPDEAALLMEAIRQSVSPEDGLWALTDRWWESRKDPTLVIGGGIVQAADPVQCAEEISVSGHDAIEEPKIVARLNPVRPAESDSWVTLSGVLERDGTRGVEQTTTEEVAVAGSMAATRADGVVAEDATADTSTFEPANSDEFISHGELAALAELGRYKYPEYARHSRYQPIGYNDTDQWDASDEGDQTTRRPVDLVAFG